MFFGRAHKQVDIVGEFLMKNNPYWFNFEVIFFDIDNQDIYPDGFLSFYQIFVDQLDIKLYEEQMDDSLSSSNACFYFKS